MYTGRKKSDRNKNLRHQNGLQLVGEKGLRRNKKTNKTSDTLSPKKKTMKRSVNNKQRDD